MLSAFELSFLPAVSFVVTVESTTCKKLEVEVRKKVPTCQVIKVFILFYFYGTAIHEETQINYLYTRIFHFLLFF